MQAPPIVAIIGRPNVGKSTLFNRLVGRRQAIVHDTPGVTRDRISGSLELDGGGRIELIDTGGLVPRDDPLGLNAQVEIAIEESDLLLMVVDGREGLTSGDHEVWNVLRSVGKPTLLVVNKADTKAAQESYIEFYALGVDEPLLVSAEHGRGLEVLVERLVELMVVDGEAPVVDAATLAIVGRPNVGKSSILNRLVGAERTLVSPMPGTTRDPTDTLIRRPEGDLLLVDTAGIRRRSQVSGVPEEIAVMMARRQIARAQVAALVLDAAQGVTAGDLSIAGSIWQMGRAPVVAINKWDLLDEESRAELEKGWERLSEVLRKPPRVNVSALSGRGIDKILPAVEGAMEKIHFRVSTSELNRILERATSRHSAPTDRGRPWSFLYATQVSSVPPTFMLFANRSLPRQDPYRRYLENRLRASLELDGVPIRLVIRQRRRKEIS